MIEKLRQLLILEEGLRLKPYRCSELKLTIGVGRNLDDVGITKEEALYLLDNDIKKVFTSVEKKYDWFKELDDVRKIVVLDMVYNLGLAGFSKFYNLIAHLTLHQYTQAAIEMGESVWAEQVGVRAKRLAHMMKTGEFDINWKYKG